MPFTIGQKLTADHCNNPDPSGDMTLGDDLFLANGSLLQWGSDTNLYRNAADQLKTDDTMKALAFKENSGAVTVTDSQNTSGTTTSITFTPTLTGGTACGFTFVAPQSGAVVILNACNEFNSGAAGHNFCAPRVRTGGTIGSGSDILSANDNKSVVHGGTNADNATRHVYVNGLTPGTTYNVQQVFRVDSGTGTFNNKELTLMPVMM